MSNLATGTSIDERFVIAEYIDSGGMGAVYRAAQVGLDRDVALKLLHDYLLEDKDSLQRFEREAVVLQTLVHKNICLFFCYGLWQGQKPYIAMEYLPGRTLSQLIAESGRLPWRQALAIVLAVARGLEHAHAAGVVHRDVKPSNIFIVAEGGSDVVKVADFGLSKLAGSQKLTATGFLLGSAHYLSPEQARGQGADERSDIYSLGCVLYECLWGQPPFDADTSLGVIFKHASEPVPVNVSDPAYDNLPEQIPELLLRCLQKDSARRYGRMSEVCQVIESALVDQKRADCRLPDPGQSPPVVAVSGRAERMRRLAGRGIFVASLLVLMLALVFRQQVADALSHTCERDPGRALTIGNWFADHCAASEALPFLQVAAQPDLPPREHNAMIRLQAMAKLAHVYRQTGSPEQANAIMLEVMKGLPRYLTADVMQGASDADIERVISACLQEFGRLDAHALATTRAGQALVQALNNDAVVDRISLRVSAPLRMELLEQLFSWTVHASRHDLRTLAVVAMRRAAALLMNHQREEAIKVLESVRGLAKLRGPGSLDAGAYQALGSHYLNLAAWPQAEEMLAKALAAMEDSQDTSKHLECCLQLIGAQFNMGKREPALWDKAWKIADSHGDDGQMSTQLLKLVIVHRMRTWWHPRWQQFAERLLREERVAGVRDVEPLMTAWQRFGTPWVPEVGLAFFQNALQMLRKNHNPDGNAARALCAAGIGWRGRCTGKRSYMRTLSSIATETDYGSDFVHSLPYLNLYVSIANCQLVLGELKECRQSTALLAKTVAQRNTPVDGLCALGEVFLLDGDIAWCHGQLEIARQKYHNSVGAYSQIGWWGGMAGGWWRLARIETWQKHYKQAIDHVESALKLLDREARTYFVSGNITCLAVDRAALAAAQGDEASVKTYLDMAAKVDQDVAPDWPERLQAAFGAISVQQRLGHQAEARAQAERAARLVKDWFGDGNDPDLPRQYLFPMAAIELELEHYAKARELLKLARVNLSQDQVLLVEFSEALADCWQARQKGGADALPQSKKLLRLRKAYRQVMQSDFEPRPETIITYARLLKAFGEERKAGNVLRNLWTRRMYNLSINHSIVIWQMADLNRTD